ncbi:hypothetical protein [Mesomycoplasma conjunctivae]|uniref:hypothetical protein n=1 Tax=Mesomycoplasma conjunctivae TaxID=45361 RepID=UPI003DA64518
MKRFYKVFILVLLGVAIIWFVTSQIIAQQTYTNKNIKITINSGVKKPGTKIFKSGTTLREILFVFEINPDVDLSSLNLNQNIRIDMIINLKKNTKTN